MNELHKFDVVVIGSGPGGEGAAMTAVKNGAKVAVIDRYRQVGGACTHLATIPSKALRHAVYLANELRSNALFAEIQSDAEITFSQLRRSAESVIGRQVAMRKDFYDRNRVKVFHGQGRFIGDEIIEVRGQRGVDRVTATKGFVVATGARPYRPPDVNFDHPRVFDSDTILRLDRTPQTITVYGAGVVGAEYASIFRNLRIKVDLVNTRDRLLSFLDDEIIDALSYHLRDGGVIIRNNEEYESVETSDDCVTLVLKSGKRLESEVLLWANGRTGNTDDMGLEKLGVETDSRGQVRVDEFYRTSKTNVYAVGDVVGFPALASAAYDQGRFASEHLVTGRCDHRLVQLMPNGIYTTPEISSIGRTERELTEAKIPYEVGRSQFRSLARAQITGNTVGMLKILFHRSTFEILGIHCFGYQAAEIVHIGQAIMSQPGEANSLMYFIKTTFNYPTMAEAYRVAALNGFNRVKGLG